MSEFEQHPELIWYSPPISTLAQGGLAHYEVKGDILKMGWLKFCWEGDPPRSPALLPRTPAAEPHSAPRSRGEGAEE